MENLLTFQGFCSKKMAVGGEEAPKWERGEILLVPDPFIYTINLNRGAEGLEPLPYLIDELKIDWQPFATDKLVSRVTPV